MAIWGDAAQLAAAVNIVILLALCSIWMRNYRQFRSKHALGLLVFGLLMLAENGLALYFLAVDPMLMMEGVRQRAQTTLRLLMTAAFLFLAWITWE
jgi:uncharacterized membrane protein